MSDHSNFYIPFGFSSFIDILSHHYGPLMGMDRMDGINSHLLIDRIIAEKLDEFKKKEQAADKVALELAVEEEMQKARNEKDKDKKERKVESKRRRRQRKKLNKQIDENDDNNCDDTEAIEKDEESGEDNETDAIDVNSAFVSAAAEKILKSNPKKNSTVQIKKTENGRETKIENLSPSSQTHPVTVLGFKGFNLARDGRFDEAIETFTKALAITPEDFRLYVNRCLCYIQIHQYEKALEDAENCIRNNPACSKGYLSKGEAYLGLNNFNSAEQAFEQALKVDPDCQEASNDLFYIQMKKLTDMGFSRSRATFALQNMRTINAAAEFLLSNPNISDGETADEITQLEDTGESEIYISDDEDLLDKKEDEACSVTSTVASTSLCSSATTEKVPVCPYMDVTNPYHCTKLYMGNISPRITQKYLEKILSRYGQLLSVKLVPSSKCAFVAYSDWKTSGEVMEKLQNWSLMAGTPPIIIKYPNSDLHKLSGGLLPQNTRSKVKTDLIKNDTNVYVERDNWCSQTMPPPSPAPSLTSVRSTYSQAVLHSPQKSKNKPAANSSNNISCGSLYIGNILQNIQERELVKIFGKYGKVISVRIIPDKKCAFVNFENSNSAALALSSLHGKSVFPGFPPIVIRYPTKAIKTVDKKDGNKASGGQVLGDECYNWRTLGCSLGKACPNKHVPQHKGIALRHKTKYTM